MLALCSTDVEASAVIMIFVSKGYFKSKNCLREVRCTVDKGKPIALAHDSATYLSTYMPFATIRDTECPSEMQSILREHEVVPWHRIQEFQRVSLKLLAEQLLLGCPVGVSGPFQEGNKIGLFIPGELPLQSKALQRRVVYASPHNPGALAVAKDLTASMGGRLEVTGDFKAITENKVDAAKKISLHRQVTTVLTARDTTVQRTAVFLLYLNDETFLHAAGKTLAEELRTVRAKGSTVQVIMVHENENERGGCDFGIFFDGRTPQDLLQGGLFKVC